MSSNYLLCGFSSLFLTCNPTNHPTLLASPPPFSFPSSALPLTMGDWTLTSSLHPLSVRSSLVCQSNTRDPLLLLGSAVSLASGTESSRKTERGKTLGNIWAQKKSNGAWHDRSSTKLCWLNTLLKTANDFKLTGLWLSVILILLPLFISVNYS